MKFPLSWLKQFIDLPEPAEAIAEALTSIGIEVEAIVPVGLDFTNVIVASVLTTTPHPNSSDLCCASVSDGDKQYQVVCGAFNCRPGIKVAFARPGAVLKEMTITERNLRGVLSQGMLCSHEELGLQEGVAEGILELADAYPLGADLALLLAPDKVFEVSLTPNLAHCLSIKGLAYELAAYYNRPLQEPTFSFAEEGRPIAPIKIHIQDETICKRYACRLIRNVKIGLCADWMKHRLEACGLQSINPVVDATNLVMLETGQPLHAYDYNRLHASSIHIRYAKDLENFTALDGKQYSCTASTLLIADASYPIAIAGVIGSAESAISSTTQDVLLEAAHFAPPIIRRSAKQLGLTTQASYRFERGIDIDALTNALDRAAALIAAVCQGEVAKNIIDWYPSAVKAKKIHLRIARIKQVLGIDISLNQLEQLIPRIHLKIVSRLKDTLDVAIPSYRHDLNQEIDLIEEIARFYGYYHLHKKEPTYYRVGALANSAVFDLEQAARKILLRQGLQELLTCDLISKQAAETISFHDRSLIHILNPSSLDQSILRPSLLPGHLQVVKHNADHQLFNLSGFEIGRIHFKLKDAFYEKSVAAITLTGDKTPANWQYPKVEPVDFYVLKAIVEQFLEAFSLPSVMFQTSKHQAFHPNQQAAIILDEREIGILGQIHPLCLCSNQPVFYAEINLEDLLGMLRPLPKMMPLPQFPHSTRDATFIVLEEVPVQTLLQACLKSHFTLLEHTSVLDLYRGESVGSGWKSITLRFIYRDREKTIAHSAVEAEHAQIMQTIHETLKGKIKS